jgi:flagellar FliL protein
MATNRLEAAKAPADDALKAQPDKAAAPAAGGGAKAWIPLLANIVLMPVVAWGLTTFVLVPKIQGGSGHAEAAEGGHGEAAPKGEGEKGPGKGKVTAPLGGKVLVNVAGTAGTRYLVANMTLVGKNPLLREMITQNDAQLRDAAASILGAKTISDIEKPGMRNIIRSELISAFNDILGKETVTDIYFTEFAIQ